VRRFRLWTSAARPVDPELERAKRQTKQSREIAERQYRTSVAKAQESQQAAGQLRRHNAANHYGDFLEGYVRRGAR
jgi:hypothetical protein